ncbi:MAG: hypothetical protein RIC55_18430 [Pirellulaceae bacterium]
MAEGTTASPATPLWEPEVERELFPLPLAPFEKYMLLDDAERQPMAFFIRLYFTGAFDEAAFRKAVHIALGRHPLLRSLVIGDPYRYWKWEPVASPQVPIDVAPRDAPLRFPEGRARIDLQKEIGLRIWVRTDEQATEIQFQFHHSTCDGIGAYRYIEDVLAAYDQQLKGDDAGDWRPISIERLTRRTHFGQGWFGRLMHLPWEVWGVVIGMIIFFSVRPANMPAPEEPKLTPEDEGAVLDMPAYTFEKADYDVLRGVAREAGATVNDLLVRDHLLGMHAWLKQHDPDKARWYLRDMVPVNLRGAEDDALPATNVVGMVFVDRKMHWYKTPRRLLRGIKFETAWLKVMRLATAWSRCCNIMLHWVPGGVDMLIKLQRPMASSSLSNMGRIFYGHTLRTQDGQIAAGDLLLERAESAPPIRPFTCSSITTLSYNGKLTVCMNYDRYHLTPDAAQGLLDAIIDRMKQTIREEQEAQAAKSGPSDSPREAA